MEKKHLIFNFILSFILSFAVMPICAQQTQKVNGIVVYEDGEAVIGAAVKVEGTTIGVQTDLDGKFSITVPEKKRLIISYIGYKPQIISNFSNTRIVLKEDVTDLEEVVVVGYGTQKKATLTGSVATVNPAEIADLSTTSLSAALEGMITGVSVSQSSNRPGEAASITIRKNDLAPGAPSSSTTLLTPLYVIDDFITSQSAFNNLDPSVIESISFLKDAAAAVYGARSAQGVILVKTKRGEIGKPKINYNGQFGYTDEFYRSKMMDSYNFGVTWNAIRAADPTQTGFDAQKHLFQADELEAMKSLNYDLLDKYWSSALAQKHSVTASGGNESATYFGSVSYITQDGNMGKIDYSRWNYRAGMDLKINKWVKASLQVSGDYGSTRKANNKVGGTNAEKDYVVLQTRPRYIPEYVTDPNGNRLPIAAYGITNGRIEQTQEYDYNSIENLNNFVENMPQNTTINTSIEYDFGWSNILKGLKLKGTYSKNVGTTKDNEYGSSYTLYRFPDGVAGRGGSGNHLYVGTEGYPLDFSNITTVSVDNGSYLRRNMSRSDSYQLNFYATYARSFGLHDVSALFTIEKSESESEYVWGNVTLPYTFTNLQSNGAGGDQTTQFSRSEAGTLSYVGRLNYMYANKYLAEFQIRSDASTRLAPENYWGVFPSLSIGWVISEEGWFKDHVKFVDFLKIRGSYGMLGRDNVAAWAWLQTYGSETVKGPIFGNNPDVNAGAHFQIPNAVPNRNSHWDKSYKSNFGLDANFLRSRLSVTLDGYYDRYREVFMSITNTSDFPGTIGAQASASNYGSIDNYGVELSLSWRDKIGKNMKYWVKLNTSLDDNKIIKYPWTAAATRELDALMPNERADRGLWGYNCIGMFRNYQEIAEYFAEYNITTYMGKTQADVHPGMLIYKDVRGSQKPDGTYYAPGDANDPEGNKIDKNDRIRISNRKSNPYGFTLNFGGEYKRFSFSAQLGASWGSYSMIPTQAISNKSIVSTVSGYDAMQYTNLPSFWSGNMFVYNDVLDAQGRVVASQNLNAKYPNLRFADVNSVESTFWKVNNANVFLRNVTLAYTLPSVWVKKAGIESCRINVTGQNIMEFYNPYPDKFMSPNSPYSTYPLLRKITVGLNVSF